MHSQIFDRNQHSAVHHMETVSQYHIENSGVPHVWKYSDLGI